MDVRSRKDSRIIKSLLSGFKSMFFQFFNKKYLLHVTESASQTLLNNEKMYWLTKLKRPIILGLRQGLIQWLSMSLGFGCFLRYFGLCPAQHVCAICRQDSLIVSYLHALLSRVTARLLGCSDSLLRLQLDQKLPL